MEALDLENLCNEVCRVSREVGRFIQAEQKRLTASGIEAKGANDFVTYVDKAAETLLVSELTALLPGASFLTEEKTVEENPDAVYRWIIDPIDGTTNFIHGIPLYSISIALQFHKQTILGVVYEICSKECFHAIFGRKSKLNDQEISVSPRKKLSDSLLVTGFPYRFENKLEPWMALFKDLLVASHGLRRLGSAAIDLAWVACGRFEAFYEYGLSPWDVAAGAFIVQQAGGRVSDYSDTENYVFGKELVADNGHIHDELLQIIRKHLAIPSPQ